MYFCAGCHKTFIHSSLPWYISHHTSDEIFVKKNNYQKQIQNPNPTTLYIYISNNNNNNNNNIIII